MSTGTDNRPPEDKSKNNKRNYYLSVNSKFVISVVIALLWTIFCIFISIS